LFLDAQLIRQAVLQSKLNKNNGRFEIMKILIRKRVAFGQEEQSEETKENIEQED